MRISAKLRGATFVDVDICIFAIEGFTAKIILLDLDLLLNVKNLRR